MEDGKNTFIITLTSFSSIQNLYHSTSEFRLFFIREFTLNQKISLAILIEFDINCPHSNQRHVYVFHLKNDPTFKKVKLKIIRALP